MTTAVFETHRTENAPLPSSTLHQTLGVALSDSGNALLKRLLEQSLINRIVSRDEEIGAVLTKHWNDQHTLIFIGAIGAVTRLIAPLLKGKEHDPAVLVLDPHGTHVIPLLGGHSGGAERRARELAANLGGTAVITGSCASDGRIALDEIGRGWGWRRSGSVKQWRELMKAMARGKTIRIRQSSGCTQWSNGSGQSGLEPVLKETEPADLSIGVRVEAGCAWHPPALWLGLGCERDSSPSLVNQAVENALLHAGLATESVAGIASIDRKADEDALLQLSEQRDWPFLTFSAEELNAVVVPTPSELVQAEMGTASVAEASALLAAGPDGVLRVPKQISHATESERGAVTVAIAESAKPFAPQRGELHLVGSGPGDPSLLSRDASAALARCNAWVGYGRYLDLLEPLRKPDQTRFDGQLTQERDRCAEALTLAQQGVKVALISSGDSGIYGMAGLAIELWVQQPEHARPTFQVHPGISALQMAAARAGAPLMHDFCTISLSDRLTPWPLIKQRLKAAAEGDFVVALYNPRSRDRHWQLGIAREMLLEHRPATTPVSLARQLGRSEEEVRLTCLADMNPDDVDMLTLVLIGNSCTYVSDGQMVTPRGYPGSEMQ